MSLKPPKKSDKNKEWMKKRQDRGIRIHPEYHLIVTEGTKTEPQYFEALKSAINSVYQEKIHLDIRGEGDNTLSLLEKARKRAQDNANTYKHVWIVYDTDDFPAERINKTVTECAELSTEETTYHPIWSNQCIELWYLLHFSYMHSDIYRAEYWPKLNNCLSDIGAGKYEKGRADMYKVLRPYLDKAIANARKLDASNNGRQPTQAAPGTKVYELIEKLRPYL